MSKVLLIGRGPLPGTTEQGGGFAQLRLWSFRNFLLNQGHEVRVLDITTDFDPFSQAAPQLVLEHSLWADACVSAGPFLPALVASWVHPKQPLWVDWPSDPLADFHARLHAPESVTDASAWSAVQEVVHSALTRADALSVISDRQKWASLGQLLLLGRQDARLAQHIHTIPIAFSFPHTPSFVPTRLPDEPLKVILCGSANTWLDDAGICQGMERTFEKLSNVSFAILGGPVAGHYMAGWKRIQAWSRKFPQKVALFEWLPQDQLQRQLQQAHAGIWLDHHGVEPLLGSRTRALLYAWMHMSILGSVHCELSQFLCASPGFLPLQSPLDIAPQLQQLHQLPHTPAQLEQQFTLLQHQFAPEHIYAPLQHWLVRPTRLSSFTSPIHTVIAEKQRYQQQLHDLHNSPSWKLSNRLHRAIRQLRDLW